jgi:hypothetical protein
MREESIVLFQKFYAGINVRGNTCIFRRISTHSLAPVEKRKRRRDKIDSTGEGGPTECPNESTVNDLKNS